MAQYKLLGRAYIGNVLREPGEVVELNLPPGVKPGAHLEPIVVGKVVEPVRLEHAIRDQVPAHDDLV